MHPGAEGNLMYIGSKDIDRLANEGGWDAILEEPESDEEEAEAEEAISEREPLVEYKT
jgi:hypothetical protein